MTAEDMELQKLIEEQGSVIDTVKQHKKKQQKKAVDQSDSLLKQKGNRLGLLGDSLRAVLSKKFSSVICE